jgi:hypothetical protein
MRIWSRWRSDVRQLAREKGFNPLAGARLNDLPWSRLLIFPSGWSVVLVAAAIACNIFLPWSDPS